jgi:phosphoserine phosphatase RsbU/P
MIAKILVVDDEPDLQHLITQKFRKQIKEQSMEFAFAANGVEAMAKLQNDESFDLVLTDINMPEMDGLTLLTRMKELQNPLRRSVIVSAYGDMENIRTAMNRGAFDFVIKPIDLNDLEITINRSLTDLQTLKEAVLSRDKLVAVQQELDIARTIQTSILPKTFPAFPDHKEFDIYAEMFAAKEVGGDLYDFFLIDKYRLGFVVGDVAGKGVPAAMFMAVSKTLIKATALKGIPSDTCLEIVNNILVEESLPSMFVTVFYGILDMRSGVVEYCLGGHMPPYVISKNGQVTPAGGNTGLVVGAIKNIEYQCQMLTLQSGDALFVYTDGVTEAMNQNEEFFEESRLEKALSSHCHLPIDGMIKGVISDVQAFSQGVPQSDDITCLVIKYNSK